MAKTRDITLWLILPAILILFPFIYRFLLCPGYWYFHINLSITSITTLYTILYSLSHRHSDDHLLFFIFLFQIPIMFLAILGATENPFRQLIAKEGGLQSLIGIFQGILGVYVFLMGSKLKINRSNYGEVEDALRYIINIITLFSIIISLSIFAIRAEYTTFWVLRSVVLISGFIIGAFTLSMGFVFGRNVFILLFVGVITVFSINFISGIIIMPLTRIGEIIFPSMAAFVLNTTLFTGLVGYLLSDENCPLTQILQEIKSKLID